MAETDLTFGVLQSQTGSFKYFLLVIFESYSEIIDLH